MAGTGLMLSFDRSDRRFNCRAAAVVVHPDRQRVLLHRSDNEDFWSLPGGRIELGESSFVALARELREELGTEATVERLLWIAEEFFVHLDVQWHALVFYCLVGLPADSPAHTQDTWSGVESFVPAGEGGAEPGAGGRGRLVFQWFGIDALRDVNLYPRFLQDRLRALPSSPEHLICDD